MYSPISASPFLSSLLLTIVHMILILAWLLGFSFRVLSHRGKSRESSKETPEWKNSLTGAARGALQPILPALPAATSSPVLPVRHRALRASCSHVIDPANRAHTSSSFLLALLASPPLRLCCLTDSLAGLAGKAGQESEKGLFSSWKECSER